jgi:hypothetical protein
MVQSQIKRESRIEGRLIWLAEGEAHGELEKDGRWHEILRRI